MHVGSSCHRIQSHHTCVAFQSRPCWEFEHLIVSAPLICNLQLRQPCTDLLDTRNSYLFRCRLQHHQLECISIKAPISLTSLRALARPNCYAINCTSLRRPMLIELYPWMTDGCTDIDTSDTYAFLKILALFYICVAYFTATLGGSQGKALYCPRPGSIPRWPRGSLTSVVEQSRTSPRVTQVLSAYRCQLVATCNS